MQIIRVSPFYDVIMIYLKLRAFLHLFRVKQHLSKITNIYGCNNRNVTQSNTPQILSLYGFKAKSASTITLQQQAGLVLSSKTASLCQQVPDV